jgi:hypothetical protein
MIMEAIFETNPVFLSSLLADLRSGKIQLPANCPISSVAGYGKTIGSRRSLPQYRAPSRSAR